MVSPPDLIEAARTARETAYAPYSEFTVGAALLTSDGTTFTGSNVEWVTFSNTIHAEMAAVSAAARERYRGPDALEAIAVVTRDPLSWPCGNCRQCLAEFAGPELDIYVEAPEDADTTIEHTTLGDLLPNAFTDF